MRLDCLVVSHYCMGGLMCARHVFAKGLRLSWSLGLDVYGLWLGSGFRVQGLGFFSHGACTLLLAVAGVCRPLCSAQPYQQMLTWRGRAWCLGRA